MQRSVRGLEEPVVDVVSDTDIDLLGDTNGAGLGEMESDPGHAEIGVLVAALPGNTRSCATTSRQSGARVCREGHAARWANPSGSTHRTSKPNSRLEALPD